MWDNIITYLRSAKKFQSFFIWGFIFLFSFVQTWSLNTNMALMLALANTSSMIIVYYVTRCIIIPKLFLRRSKIFYVLASILLIYVVSHIGAYIEFRVFSNYQDLLPFEAEMKFSTIKYVVALVLTYSISTILFFTERDLQERREKENLLEEKKILETRVLKSQINSHFIFNALNNIYSMTYFKDEYISGYVLKLSQMMRYVMEDCDTELTPLGKEIEYIDNFIEFQKLRFDGDRNISFTYNKDDASSINVPPMIFQPLVENCFKHCPLDVEVESYVQINLKIEKKRILFIAENSQPFLKKRSDTLKTGIGIENVKRRLSLYYEDNYELNIFDGKNCFRLELFINI